MPVGLAELPDPADITHDVWRDLAAGALPIEAHVSTHIVEPLLGDLLARTGLTWKREYRVGQRWADFVIVDGDAPVRMIEVKKVIKEGLQSAGPSQPTSHSCAGMPISWARPARSSTFTACCSSSAPAPSHSTKSFAERRPRSTGRLFASTSWDRGAGSAACAKLNCRRRRAWSFSSPWPQSSQRRCGGGPAGEAVRRR